MFSKTLHQMTRAEMKAHQKALKAEATAIYMDHIISGCQCVANWEPFGDFMICDTMQKHHYATTEARRVRNFRMVRFCQDAELAVAEFQDRFAAIFGVMA
jgi:hypothetical protein